jgi:hypothetical protein
MSTVCEHVNTTTSAWVYPKQAAEMLGCTRDALRRLVRRRLVASRKLPTARLQVSVADLERLARESERPAIGQNGQEDIL